MYNVRRYYSVIKKKKKNLKCFRTHDKTVVLYRSTYVLNAVNTIPLQCIIGQHEIKINFQEFLAARRQ